MKRLPGSAACVCLLLLYASLSGAQTVTGRVLDQATGAPLPGVVVQLMSTASRAEQQSLTDEEGSYRLVTDRPGTYRVRTLRIGYRPAITEPFSLAVGQELSLPALRAGAPISLDTIRVVGRNNCRAVGDASATFALWEQARTAFTAVQITGTGRAVDATVIRFQRTLDPGSRRVREEYSRVTSGLTKRPWRSLPADSLREVGYIVLDENNWANYYAPDLDVILSSEFIADHCFRIAPESNAQRVGIQFEPTRDRDDVVDIHGTMWLDRKSSELRRMEFFYTNVSDAQERARAGGEMEFARLTNGAWVVSRWSITMPVLEQHMVAASGFGKGRIPETIVSELRVEGGAVALVRQRGDTLWASSPVVLAGTVVDSSTGTGIAGADVALRGTALHASTDSSGIFRIRGTLPGEYMLDVRTPLMQSLGGTHATPVVLTDSATVLTVRVPSAAQVAQNACGDHSGGLVAGRVVIAGDSLPPRDVKVVAEWSEVAARSNVDVTQGFMKRAKWLEARTDMLGLYRICGVPLATEISVRAETDSSASAPVVVTASRAAPLATADLTVAQRVDNAVFAGRVLSDFDGAPMADVEVVLADLERNTFTNAEGRFRLANVPPGKHAIQVRHIGYRQFADSILFLPGHTVQRTVMLSRVQILDTVAVTANHYLVEFEENRKIGLGTFFTRADIEKIRGMHVSVLLDAVNGAEVVKGKGSHAWIASKRGVGRSSQGVDPMDLGMGARPGECYAQVWIDGQAMYRGHPGGDPRDPPEPLFDINSIPPESIEAIEYYPGPASTPMRYSLLGSQCGVIVIHMRRYEPDTTAKPSK